MNFCNEYIWPDDPREEPLITSGDFFIYAGMFIFILTIAVWLFKQEEYTPVNENTFKESYMVLKGFFKNHNVLYIIIIKLLW